MLSLSNLICAKSFDLFHFHFFSTSNPLKRKSLIHEKKKSKKRIKHWPAVLTEEINPIEKIKMIKNFIFSNLVVVDAVSW